MKTTVADILDAYEASRTPIVKNPGAVRYSVRLLRSAFGSIMADRLSAEMIDRERAKMTAEGYAEGSVDRIFRGLRAAFRLAVRDRKLTWVPRIEMYHQEDARQGFVEPEEFEAILAELQTLDAVIADLWIFSYYSGRRPSELQGLQWADVSWPERTARIARSKNRRPWIIVLEGPLFEVVQRRAQAREAGSEFVFRQWNGQPIDDNLRNRTFRKAKTRAGYPDRIFYDLRRTAARDMINAGVDPTTTMATLGHATRAMLDRYGIRTVDDQRRAISRLVEMRQPASQLPLPR